MVAVAVVAAVARGWEAVAVVAAVVRASELDFNVRVDGRLR